MLTLLRRTGVLLKLLPSSVFALVLLSCLLLPSRGHALGGPSGPTSAANSWASLTPVQQQALAPLARDWASFPVERRQKWLAFADKFQKMKPEDQKRAQEKMDEWVKLTPEQRLSARENYIRSNKLEPDKRAQKWEEYKQLTDEQKAQLASHEKKKLVTNLPTPAESKEKKLQPLKTPNKPAPTPGSPAALSSATKLAPATAPALTAPPSAPAPSITNN